MVAIVDMLNAGFVLVQGDVAISDCLENDDVIVDEHPTKGFEVFVLSVRGYEVLASHGMIQNLRERLAGAEKGVYTIPRSVIDPEAAREVRQHLDYMASFGEPGAPGDDAQCSLPTCQQDGEDRSRGFLLCAEHADQLQDWDDLVA